MPVLYFNSLTTVLDTLVESNCDLFFTALLKFYFYEAVICIANMFISEVHPINIHLGN